MTTSESEKVHAATPTRHRNIIVVGASAGGVEALSEFVRNLPADLPAAVFVVLHIAARGTSVLPDILKRRGKLPALSPEDNEVIQNGRIYVAPPDRHLLIEDGRIRVSRGPKENSFRPAIDPLFRSAAWSKKQRVIGVILSGTLDDGTAGMLAIKRFGGLAVVQDPEDALFNGMIVSVMENVEVDHIAPISEMGALLARLVAEPLPDVPSESTDGDNPDRELVDMEIGASMMEPDMLDVENRPHAHASVYSCPECGGVLWEVEDDDILRFRCRTGHAFSSASLMAEQGHMLEAALWSALRALEESASLTRRLEERARKRGHQMSVNRFVEQASETEQRIALIRQVLATGVEAGIVAEEAKEAEADDLPPPNGHAAR